MAARLFSLTMGNMECKIFMYFASVFTQAASLLLLLMTYDKFYVFRNPLKTSSHNNLKRLKIGVFVTYFLVLTGNVLTFPGIKIFRNHMSLIWLQYLVPYRITDLQNCRR